MVNITIYIEGGVLYHPNIDALTMDNSATLRQSLHRIFQEIVGQEVQITVLLKSGVIAAYKQFASASDETMVLFVDSDCPPQKIKFWFTAFEKSENEKKVRRGEVPNFSVPEELRKKIYFMIQEMETWILKDFESIERWAKKNDFKRLRAGEVMSQHPLVKKKNAEDISEPSKKIASLLKLFFQKQDGKKVEYGKLKNAPDILDCINVPVLLSKDLELTRFAASIRNNT